jgi:hypothetical protein
MQQGFIEGYRFLLTNLIPREFLSEKRREGIEAALHTDRREELVTEAYLCMEELSDTGIYLKSGFRKTDDAVILEYRRKNQNSGITLEMSRGEYDSLPHMQEEEGARDRFTEIIMYIMSELSLDGRSTLVADKVTNILSLTSRVNPDSEGYLVLDSSLTLETRADRIHQDDFYSIISRNLYRRALEEN